MRELLHEAEITGADAVVVSTVVAVIDAAAGLRPGGVFGIIPDYTTETHGHRSGYNTRLLEVDTFYPSAIVHAAPVTRRRMS